MNFSLSLELNLIPSLGLGLPGLARTGGGVAVNDQEEQGKIQGGAEGEQELAKAQWKL